MAAMRDTEVRKLVSLEDTHWWYRERRHLLARSVKGLRPGRALDIGAAGGGNTRVLRDAGWDAVALEYGDEGARSARARGLMTVQADATKLPMADGSLDLVVAFDILEHLEDDVTAATEMRRVLRPEGTCLVAVPADPKLWSEHDEAVDHMRRYTRETLTATLSAGGLDVVSMDSWNVLLRPVVWLRRKKASGSDLEAPHRLVDAALRAVVTIERGLPVKQLPGVSLLVRARPRR
jgi:SAM-dependent methyltransferase